MTLDTYSHYLPPMGDQASGAMGDATELVIGESAQRMEGVCVPPMRELLSKLREHRTTEYV